MENLDKRKWPKSPPEDERFKGIKIKNFLKLRAEYEKSAFVSEGHVEVRRLGASSFTMPIPPGETAITSLICYQDGKIYGGTSGKKAHLFYYDPSPDGDAIVDIGIVEENAKITSLVCGKDGKIYGSVSSEKGGFLFSYTPSEILLENLDISEKGLREIFDLPAKDQIFHSIVDPCCAIGKIEKIEFPVKEGISSMVIDKLKNKIYGITSEKGIFFIYDIASGKFKIKEEIDEIREFSKKLVIDKNGYVYGAVCKGEIFRYDSNKDKVEKPGLLIPSLKGRELYNRVDYWVFDEEREVIYGGTIDGILFIFNPVKEEIICLGKPIAQTRTRALAVSKDGRVYGICGEKCCHMFLYNPYKRELKDLGVLLATVETPWYGYEFESAATGKNGEIYFGESDRISYLFIYFPPIMNFNKEDVKNE